MYMCMCVLTVWNSNGILSTGKYWKTTPIFVHDNDAETIKLTFFSVRLYAFHLSKTHEHTHTQTQKA